MEILSSACLIVILYCTEWFGLRHCVALPVPTLSNYYQQSNSNNWDFEYRQLRNPEMHKFVFPSKEFKMNRRSGGFGTENTGKIFFPDEMPASKEKTYKYSESETRPIWKMHGRPSAAIPSIREPELDLGFMSSNPPTEEGTYGQQQPPRRKSPPKRKKIQTTANDNEPAKAISSELASLLDVSDKQLSEEQLVNVAAKEFYQWLKHSKSKKKDCKHSHQSSTGLATSSNQKITGDNISEHTLAAGFKDLKCPDGQVRVESGDCKDKVEV